MVLNESLGLLHIFTLAITSTYEYSSSPVPSYYGQFLNTDGTNNRTHAEGCTCSLHTRTRTIEIPVFC